MSAVMTTTKRKGLGKKMSSRRIGVHVFETQSGEVTPIHGEST